MSISIRLSSMPLLSGRKEGEKKEKKLRVHEMQPGAVIKTVHSPTRAAKEQKRGKASAQWCTLLHHNVGSGVPLHWHTEPHLFHPLVDPRILSHTSRVATNVEWDRILLLKHTNSASFSVHKHTQAQLSRLHKAFRDWKQFWQTTVTKLQFFCDKTSPSPTGALLRMNVQGHAISKLKKLPQAVSTTLPSNNAVSCDEISNLRSMWRSLHRNNAIQPDKQPFLYINVVYLKEQPISSH